MKSVRWPLTLAFLSAGLALIAFLFVTILGGGRIGFLYGRTPGFAALRSVMQWAGVVAGLGFLAAAAIVAVPLALRPAPWLNKVPAVLPILLLLFALAGIAAALAGIGTVGTLAVLPLAGPVSFATAWLALGAVAAVAGVVIAVASGGLVPASVRPAAMVMGFTSLATVVAALAMVGALIIVANNQPSLPAFGGRGEARIGPAAGGEGAFEGSGQQPGQGRARGGTGQGGQAGALAGGGGQGEGAFAGRGGEGGFGGPGGGLAALRQQFMTAGGLLVAFALVEVFATLAGLARARQAAYPPDAENTVTAGRMTGSGLGGAVTAGLAVGLVAFGAMQLVPVDRTNPPVQSNVQWDSPQTQQLWQRACADCHSNQTQWPWYTAVAPVSWLTAEHVDAGRQRFNVSQPNGRGGFGRNESAGESSQQIRSGAMPPADYTLIHPAARLTAAEKQQLIQGLQSTLGQ